MSCCKSSHGIEHRVTPIPSLAVMYSGNTIPPQWIRIFHANKSTSRRTQAAAIAYMLPHYVNQMNIRVHMRCLTARNRCSKLESYLVIISPPPHFAGLADIHTDLAQNKAVLVCDGGLDHQVPSTPPPEQGKYFFVNFCYLSVHACLLLFVIIGKNHSMESPENKQRYICPTASGVSCNGFVHADD